MDEQTPLTHDEDQQNLLEDDRGVVFVEYLTLASVVTIVGAASVFMLGIPMVRLYEWGSMLVTIPIP